eukprot:5635724-Pleurochrysis_carterae.AAC.3
MASVAEQRGLELVAVGKAARRKARGEPTVELERARLKAEDKLERQLRIAAVAMANQARVKRRERHLPTAAMRVSSLLPVAALDS